MRFVRSALVLTLVIALGAGTFGCNRGGGDVAARVNGEPIMKSEVDAQVEQLIETYPTMFEGEAGEQRLIEFRQRILDNLINNVLIVQAAKDRGIEVTEADLDEEVDKLKAGYPDEAQFENAIEGSGMTIDQLRDSIREQLINSKIIEELTREAAEPTEEEIAAYYEENIVQFSEKAGKRASHILFESTDRATADEVRARIAAGEDFAELAEEYSIDTATASRGGDLGWPTQPYAAEFQAALDSLDVNEVSQLVQTEFGWHIIKVTDERADRQKPLDEVREQIVQFLVQQRRAELYSEFLDQLRAEATIEILDPDLKAAESGSGESVEPTDDAAAEETPADDAAAEEEAE